MEDVGLSAGLIHHRFTEDTVASLWSDEFVAELKEALDDGGSCVGIAACLDWYSQHKDNTFTQDAQTTLQSVKEICALQKFILPNAIKRLVGLEIDVSPPAL